MVADEREPGAAVDEQRVARAVARPRDDLELPPADVDPIAVTEPDVRLEAL